MNNRIVTLVAQHGKVIRETTKRFYELDNLKQPIKSHQFNKPLLDLLLNTNYRKITTNGSVYILLSKKNQPIKKYKKTWN